ncbi:MAG: hypothetical protein Q7K26_00630 [bacterium]|nr:hypothetical protein [bacterium]
MTPKQEAAAKKLEAALKDCAASKLAVYIFDGSLYVCPPEYAKGANWYDNPDQVCEEFGRGFFIPGLDCDGGAGT